MIGRVLNIDENDYKFGKGPLKLRIQAVLNESELPDGTWLYVRGLEIRWDETYKPRQVLIRKSLLDTK